MSLQFRFRRQFPDEVPRLLAELASAQELVLGEMERFQRIYLDSFDWRLARSGHILELFPPSAEHADWRLELIDRDSARLLLAQQLATRPTGLDDLPSGALQHLLEPVLGIRSLLCEAYVEGESRHAEFRNKEGKTVLRLEAGHFQAHNGQAGSVMDLGYWVLLRPVRGYDKALRKVSRILAADPRLEAAEQDFFETATTALGNRPLGYSSKLLVPLEPEMPAWAALQRLLHCLFQSMRENESGTCADRDAEFLHDFRVAVRRSRVLMSDARGIIPKDRLRPFREELRWLQQITGRSRDLDVYLLALPDYRGQLEPEAAASLEPLEKFLLAEKKDEHLSLARSLRSERYFRFKREWGHFISTLGEEPGDKNHEKDILKLANRYIRKAHKRVLSAGQAINDDSPAELLHDLRKLCKHLRYLLEFFQQLYKEELVSGLIKSLKGLQEVLGDFQDFEVQSATLAGFERELLERGLAGADTAAAIEQLIKGLEGHRRDARKRFAKQFADFSDAGNCRQFASLCKTTMEAS